MKSLQRADAEPLTRADIQYDLLEAIFNDRHAVFTGPASEGLTPPRPKKITFSELYSLAIMTSPRCSKILRDKMGELPEFGIDFAKICFLINIGRINTTMACKGYTISCSLGTSLRNSSLSRNEDGAQKLSPYTQLTKD